MDPLTLGVLYYEGTDTSAIPTKGDAPASTVPALDTSFKAAQLVPADQLVIPEATRREAVTVSFQYLGDGRHIGVYQEFRALFPILWLSRVHFC